MLSWILDRQNGVAGMRLIECEKPGIGTGEVLVRMTAPGVVPFDSAIINNENDESFPTPVLPIYPGNQGVGIIEDAGRCDFAKGDRVMFGALAYGFLRPGSWAEYVAVAADDVALVPASVPDGAAAQAVVAYPTAYLAMKDAGFSPGKSMLVTAIGGSVGNAAYQLARALGAANVISTAGTTEKARRAKAAGFHNVIDLSKESMLEGVMRLNHGQGVDIVVDSLGGAPLAQALKCACRYGIIMSLGFSAGRITTIAQADLIMSRARLQGFGVYTSTPQEWREAWTTFTHLVNAEKIKPLFDRSFPFNEAPKALRYLIEQRPFGAVALDM